MQNNYEPADLILLKRDTITNQSSHQTKEKHDYCSFKAKKMGLSRTKVMNEDSFANFVPKKRANCKKNYLNITPKRENTNL